VKEAAKQTLARYLIWKRAEESSFINDFYFINWKIMDHHLIDTWIELTLIFIVSKDHAWLEVGDYNELLL
jgi:hypothetical protein